MNIFRGAPSCRFAIVSSLGLFLYGVGLWAQLKILPETVELGKYGQNKTATAEVTLINSGKEPLEILRVDADCSCTAGTPERTSLKPGERTSLKITFETRTYQGAIKRSLQVQTSQGDASIPVKIFISPYVNWTIFPYPLVMRSGALGREATASVEFTYTGEGEAEIKDLASTPALIATRLSSHEGKKFVYSLTRGADAPVGNRNIKLSAETTDAVNPRLELNVFVSGTSSVRIDPTPLIFPSARVGQTATLRGKLHGWTQAKMPRFELKQGEVKTLVPEGEELPFEIAITPSAPGSFTQLVRVYAGDRLELETPLVLRVEP